MLRSLCFTLVLCAGAACQAGDPEEAPKVPTEPPPVPTWTSNQAPEKGLPESSPIQALLQARAFDRLERALEAERAGGRAAGTFSERLDLVVDTLLAERFAADLHAWVEASPRSYLARLVRGRYFVEAAWRARGGGRASTVGKRAWVSFEQGLELARRDLEESASLTPTPHAHAALVTVAMGSGAPLAERRAHFDDARRLNPTYVNAWVQLLVAAMPKWGGSWDLLFGLCDEARESHPDEPAFHYLTVKALLELAARSGPRRQEVFEDPKIKALFTEGFDALAQAYPRAPNAWRERCRYAYRSGDRVSGRRYLWKHAALGDADSCWEVGSNYLRGKDGLPKDARLALAYYREALRRGKISACTHIGNMFYEGEGVRRNLRAAASWYRLGARLGDPHSARNLGVCHQYGYGIPKDLERAAALYRQAVELGNASAARDLASLPAAYQR
jgi:TPR repeat protein